MTPLLQDLRYAARGFRRSPGFTAVAVLILGLGIGASTTIFSLVDALYLRTLPAADPSRLVEIYQTRKPGEYFNLSYPDYRFYREHTRSLWPSRRTTPMPRSTSSRRTPPERSTAASPRPATSRSSA